MPGVGDGQNQQRLTPTVGFDDDVFQSFFELADSGGAVPLLWEQAVRCDRCLTQDTKQPRWDATGCRECSGNGVRYLPAQQITGLFRARSQYESFRRQGELEHGEAELTTPLGVQPGYVDRLVRDRFTVVAAPDDQAVGRVFFPAGPAVPFIFAGLPRAWRVQLQALRRDQQLVP